MSIKSRPMKSKHHQFQGKRERYLQPSLLMGLYLKTSYGYELIQEIQRYGFMEEKVPPGMIYRHLRRLEEDGLVSSEWETTGTGPAKRIYQITSDGKEVLRIWVDYMEGQARKLNAFVNQYNKVKKEGG
jgi:poly-beta-hydroxybutyrate-responsive repressor